MKLVIDTHYDLEFNTTYFDIFNCDDSLCLRVQSHETIGNILNKFKIFKLYNKNKNKTIDKEMYIY